MNTLESNIDKQINEVNSATEKYALIDCEYFPRCYGDNNEPYLCPSTKQECPIFNLNQLLKELRQNDNKIF